MASQQFGEPVGRYQIAQFRVGVVEEVREEVALFGVFGQLQAPGVQAQVGCIGQHRALEDYSAWC